MGSLLAPRNLRKSFAHLRRMMVARGVTLYIASQQRKEKETTGSSIAKKRILDAGKPITEQQARLYMRLNTPPENGGSDVWLSVRTGSRLAPHGRLSIAHHALQGFSTPVSVPVRDTRQPVDRAANLAHEKTLV
ncbi:hypothetical protein NLY43_13260 [Mesorhizobium sp. C416B]|uniref:hypothetical protein n=1 Tax=unclassified Mesorhizobium TaxID=325217 RepID=UPI0012EC5186|nr:MULTISPECIES: hypothetical protein [unclassified Mesorhizobium]WJI65578.1 hypothetical protein NLY43_13260 [Mesorhizobium sp. C416B]